MNADLHMADELKNTGKGNLFVIFGEPDVEVVCGPWLVTRGGKKVVSYEQCQELSGTGSLEEINRLGREDLQRLKDLSAGRAIRADQSDPAGGGVGAGEHRGGSSEDGDGDGRVSSVSQRRESLAEVKTFLVLAQRLSDSGGSGPGSGGDSSANQPHARWPQAVAAIETLTADDFPLSLTTSHYTQVTIHGVGLPPTDGEVRSDGAEGIACWFIDTNYNEESFFVRHAYFLGAGDPYKSLKTTLKSEINAEAWETLHSDTSRPFDKPKTGRIAVKVINHLGDEVMKVFRV